MEITIKAKCPYCGTVSDYRVKSGLRKYFEVIYCDTEDAPGCDLPFAIATKLNVEVSVFALTETLNELTPTFGIGT